MDYYNLFENVDIMLESSGDLTTVYQYLSTLRTPNGKLRDLRNDENPPRAFRFLASTDTSGICQYKGVKYVWAIVDDQLRVMTDREAGSNWSETIYKKSHSVPKRRILEQIEDPVYTEFVDIDDPDLSTLQEDTLLEEPALVPKYDYVKSYYGKAEVEDIDNGVVLYSYATPVACIINGKGFLLPAWDYSGTTLRHIREFFKQNDLPIYEKSKLAKVYHEVDSVADAERLATRPTKRKVIESVAIKNDFGLPASEWPVLFDNLCKQNDEFKDRIESFDEWVSICEDGNGIYLGVDVCYFELGNDEEYPPESKAAKVGHLLAQDMTAADEGSEILLFSIWRNNRVYAVIRQFCPDDQGMLVRPVDTEISGRFLDTAELMNLSTKHYVAKYSENDIIADLALDAVLDNYKVIWGFKSAPAKKKRVTID